MHVLLQLLHLQPKPQILACGGSARTRARRHFISCTSVRARGWVTDALSALSVVSRSPAVRSSGGVSGLVVDAECGMTRPSLSGLPLVPCSTHTRSAPVSVGTVHTQGRHWARCTACVAPPRHVARAAVQLGRVRGAQRGEGGAPPAVARGPLPRGARHLHRSRAARSQRREGGSVGGSGWAIGSVSIGGWALGAGRVGVGALATERRAGGRGRAARGPAGSARAAWRCRGA